MTKTELWDALKARNPQFETGPIVFTPEKLRKFFDLVWDKASEKPKNQAPDLSELFRTFGVRQ